MNITQLKADLLAARELNTKLHHRLQKCEGADLRLEALRSNMEREISRVRTDCQSTTEYWKKQYRDIHFKVGFLPFFIRWIYRL